MLTAIIIKLEHVTGIEPAYSAWEANVLPLNYTCMLIIVIKIHIKEKMAEPSFPIINKSLVFPMSWIL